MKDLYIYIVNENLFYPKNSVKLYFLRVTGLNAVNFALRPPTSPKINLRCGGLEESVVALPIKQSWVKDQSYPLMITNSIGQR